MPRAITRTSTIRALPHKIFDDEENESLGSDDQLEKDREAAKNALYDALHQKIDDEEEKVDNFE